MKLNFPVNWDAVLALVALGLAILIFIAVMTKSRTLLMFDDVLVGIVLVTLAVVGLVAMAKRFGVKS